MALLVQNRNFHRKLHGSPILRNRTTLHFSANAAKLLIALKLEAGMVLTTSCGVSITLSKMCLLLGYDWVSFRLLVTHFWHRLFGTAGIWFCNDWYFYGTLLEYGAHILQHFLDFKNSLMTLELAPARRTNKVFSILDAALLV